MNDLLLQQIKQMQIDMKMAEQQRQKERQEDRRHMRDMIAQVQSTSSRSTSVSSRTQCKVCGKVDHKCVCVSSTAPNVTKCSICSMLIHECICPPIAAPSVVCTQCKCRVCECEKVSHPSHKSDFEKLADAIKSLAGRKEADGRHADFTQRSKLPCPRLNDLSTIGFHLFLKNLAVWAETAGISNELKLYNLQNHANLSQDKKLAIRGCTSFSDAIEQLRRAGPSTSHLPSQQKQFLLKTAVTVTEDPNVVVQACDRMVTQIALIRSAFPSVILSKEEGLSMLLKIESSFVRTGFLTAVADMERKCVNADKPISFLDFLESYYRSMSESFKQQKALKGLFTAVTKPERPIFPEKQSFPTNSKQIRSRSQHRKHERPVKQERSRSEGFGAYTTSKAPFCWICDQIQRPSTHYLLDCAMVIELELIFT